MATFLGYILITVFITYAASDEHPLAINRNNKISKLLETDQWTDCIFLVGTGDKQSYVKAHRIIVALASPVLADMLYGSEDGSNIICLRSGETCEMSRNCGGEPDKKNAIALPEIEPKVFKNLLQFIYKGTVVFDNFDIANKLAQATKMYQVNQLEDTCIKYLLSTLNTSNVGAAYELAKNLGNAELLKKSIEIFQTETIKVLTDKNSINMNIDTMIDLLDQDKLNIESEVELFNSLFLYFKAQEFRQPSTSQSSSTVYDAVKKIRFLTFTVEQFLNGPAYSGLLTKDESSAILSKLISPNENLPMPEGFSSSTDERKSSSERSKVKRDVIYCKREFELTSYWKYNNVSWYNARFKANVPICIVGAEFNTQRGNTGESYEEHLQSRISTAENGDALTKCQVTQRAPYNATIEIKYEKPYCIIKDKEYDIDLSYYNGGEYPNGKGSATVTVGNVTFQFINLGSGGDVLLRSILFKYK